MDQTEAFAYVAVAAQALITKKNAPVRLAINGIEGTGKTTFALHLVEYLNNQKHPAHHVSIDRFHFDKDRRYRQGRGSADGYYEDAYDEAAFLEEVLLRSQKEAPEYIAGTHDLQSDEYISLTPTKVTPNAILVTDGCYLLKPLLRDHWDLIVYLKTDFTTAMERGAARDEDALGGYESAKTLFEKRYHAASRRYLREVKPETYADIIFDNTDFEDLVLVSKPYTP